MKKHYNFLEESKRVNYSNSIHNKDLFFFMDSSSSASALLSQGTNFPSCSSSLSADARTAAAMRSHSLAEKKRRERINAHLTTLRRMIPNSSKMDKASLLGRVIDEVRYLNKNVANINKVSTIPSEMNQVIVEFDNGNLIRSPTFFSQSSENMGIKATLCCNDRENLLSDLIKEFHLLRIEVIRVEMTSIGGRVQNVFTLCRKEGNENLCLNSIMESIRSILIKIASSSSEDSSFVDQVGKKHMFLAKDYFDMTF